MKLSTIATLALIIGYASAIPVPEEPTVQNKNTQLAPLLTPGESISNSYIIVLKNDVSTQTAKNHTGWVKTVTDRDGVHAYLNEKPGIHHVFDSPNAKGYSGIFDDEVIQLIRSSPDVSKKKNSPHFFNTLSFG